MEVGVRSTACRERERYVCSIYIYIYRCGYVRSLESGYIGVYSQLLIPKNDLIMLVGVCIEGLRGSCRSPVEAAGLLDLWFRLFIPMIEKIKLGNSKKHCIGNWQSTGLGSCW